MGLAIKLHRWDEETMTSPPKSIASGGITSGIEVWSGEAVPQNLCFSFRVKGQVCFLACLNLEAATCLALDNDMRTEVAHVTLGQKH